MEFILVGFYIIHSFTQSLNNRFKGSRRHAEIKVVFSNIQLFKNFIIRKKYNKDFRVNLSLRKAILGKQIVIVEQKVSKNQTT